MKRFIPVVVLIGLMAACADDKPLNPPPTSVAKSPTQAAKAGDDKAACATAKVARAEILNEVLMASMTFNDGKATADEIKKAAADLKAAITKLRAETTKATGQAAEGKLKDALTAFGAGVDTALTNVTAAGVDKSKLEEATDVESMNTAEKTIMALCAS